MFSKRVRTTMMTMLIAAVLLGGSMIANVSASSYDNFIRGVDVSMLSMVEGNRILNVMEFRQLFTKVITNGL